MTRRLFCLTFFYLLLTTSSALAQRQLAPLPIKEAIKTLSLPMFANMDLSPDGELVAYTLSDSNRKAQKAYRSSQNLEQKGIPSGIEYCDIWITVIATGKATNLTQGQGASWAPVWSPNGKLLAFYSDREGTPALWIWEKASGTLRKASDAIVRAHDQTFVPRWTPDSKKLVTRVFPDGMTLADAAPLVNKPEINSPGDLTKEPGSSVVLFSSKASSATTNEHVKARANDNLAAYDTDLAIIDLDTKKTRRIATRIPTENFWLSPDGTNIAALIHKGRQSDENLQALFDLSVISLTTGQSKTLVSNFGSDVLMPVSWSPDGKFLAYMTAGPTVKNDCWVVPVAGGESRNITRGEHPFFASTFVYRGPLWDANSQNIYLLSQTALWRASIAEGRATQIATITGRALTHIVSHDGRTIWTPNTTDAVVVVTRNEESNEEGFYKISLNTGKAEKLLEENKSYGFVPSLRTLVSSDRRLVYTSQSAAEPEEIWTTSIDQFRPRRVTHTNPIFDRYVMGEGRMIAWQTSNGQTARGALLLPAGYTSGKRYPVIVYQYPGSMLSTYGNLFGCNQFGSAVENWQFFATRGYAVLVADVPARPETYMKDIAAAILPAVDKVIELGIADPNRVGITGQSNGGYGVLSLIVQTNRFKAAVDRMGPGNLISLYTQMAEDGTSVYTGEMVARTGGSLWEKREEFIENSPIFYFDRVQTPLLIIQGTADQQNTVARSDEVFVSLRFLGKDVEYARYVGESHGVFEWSFPNQVDYLNRVIRWFDLWLKS